MLNLSLAFDLDGTLVNSEKIKTDAYLKALNHYDLDAGNILTYLGKGNSEKFLKKLIIKYNPNSRDIINSVLSLKNDIYKKNINNVNLFSDAKYLLKFISEMNLNKFAGIVTSSSRDQLDTIMKNLSLTFSNLVTSTDTKFHKPNPEPYQTFRELFSESDQKKLKFIAIEDTIKGALSAEAANYDIIFLIDREQKLRDEKYSKNKIKNISSLLCIKDFIEKYRLSIK